ncbi:MAG: PQQ-like beta-propeller repeat protein [Actinomycetota bacterium]|nr:PQQ-like beta-propeller repeat protein [Actinomycetota bacterium]
MLRPWPAGALGAAGLGVLLLLTGGCTGGTGPEGNSAPAPSPTQTAVRPITLADVTVSSVALAEREGVVLCGGRVVAGPPAGGIEANAFAVFDPVTGRGDLTEVDVPAGSGLEPNARWLLMFRCVDEAPGGPMLLVAYQEMPLSVTGGVGLRAAYRLDGTRVWRRTDLNLPATVTGAALVLEPVRGQPVAVVDAASGETLQLAQPPMTTQLVLSTDRMVLSGASDRPRLTTLGGRTVARLPNAAAWHSAEGALFGVDRREVVAVDLRHGELLWRLPIRPDPLGAPAVDRGSGVAVFVDARYVAHGVDLATGEVLWRVPTEMESPRVAVASGVVLVDQRDDDAQLVLDARTGDPLPVQDLRVIDLGSAGALVVVDGSPQLVSVDALRHPPTAPPSDDPTG